MSTYTPYTTSLYIEGHTFHPILRHIQICWNAKKSMKIYENP